MKKYVLSLLFCIATLSLSFGQIQVTVSHTNPCQNDGTATAIVSGGVPPYQYYWENFLNPLWGPLFTATINNLSPGYYELKVTDATGASTYGSVFLQPPFSAHILTTPDTCLLGKGSATVNIANGTGPYSYLWFNGSTNDTVFNLNKGPVSVKVTDGNGCFYDTKDMDSLGTSSYNVSYTSSFSTSIQNTVFSNCSNGQAMVSVTGGGVAPFTYSWNTLPIQTSQTAINLQAKELYTVLITDATGCTAEKSVYINTNSNLSLTSVVRPDTCGGANGSITVAALAGSPPYTYLWSNGSTATSITGLGTDTIHTVTISDNIGCKTEANLVVNGYSPVNVTVSSTLSNCNAPTGTCTAAASGGTGPYTYSWMTAPVQNNATATGLSPGTYTLYVSDANGCTRTSSAIIQDNSSMILSFTNVNNENCDDADGTATVLANNAILPVTYTWNTTPVQNTATASNLKYGQYQVMVTDGNNCIRTSKVQIGNYTPLSLSATQTDASCIYTADGTINITVNGGTAPYSYSWSEGSTTASVNSLLPGTYWVEVTDATGCRTGEIYELGYTSLSPCAIEISGNVYADINTNCLNDWGDSNLGLVKVYCNPGSGFRFTDQNGNYSFIRANPGNYDLDMQAPYWFDWSCTGRPLTVNLPVGGSSVYQPLPVQGNALDMVVYSYNSTPAVPGFDFRHLVCYKNQGSIFGAGTLKVNFDPLLGFLGSTPAPVSVNMSAGELYYNVSAWASSSIQKIELKFNTPVSMPIGYQLEFKDSITTTSPDTVLLNNYYSALDYVVGPFDPNDISVSPKGAGIPGYIATNDSLLTYIVRFQNTGNFPAQNVIIKVQADQDLDINSLEYLGSKFIPKIEADTNGLITFSFIGIFLPDSNMNEPESHGSLCFRLKQMPALSSGTPIAMSADIYFDFNSPVTTNTVINTITGLNNPKGKDNSIYVYPVPASEKLNVRFDKSLNAEYAEVYDITGRILQTITLAPGETEFNVDVRSFNPGLYLLNVKGRSVGTCRFIKQ